MPLPLRGHGSNRWEEDPTGTGAWSFDPDVEADYEAMLLKVSKQVEELSVRGLWGARSLRQWHLETPILTAVRNCNARISSRRFAAIRRFDNIRDASPVRILQRKCVPWLTCAKWVWIVCMFKQGPALELRGPPPPKWPYPQTIEPEVFGGATCSTNAPKGLDSESLFLPFLNDKNCMFTGSLTPQDGAESFAQCPRHLSALRTFCTTP